MVTSHMKTTTNDLPPDYHTHSSLCHHATGKPIDYLHAAVEKGLPAIAFTDHCPAPDGFNPEHRMQMEEFEIYREWVLQAERENSCEVLFGVEADYYRGCVEYLEPFLASQPLDIVLGSVHYLDYWKFDNFDEMRAWEDTHTEEVWVQYFTLLGELVDTGLYDVIGHFDLPKKYGKRPPLERIREYALPVLDKIAHQDMAIEINISGLYHVAHEMYPSPNILRWAQERGISITFGSDAHTPEHVGSDFEDAVRLAREAGYSESAHFKHRQKTHHPLPRMLR